MATQTPELPGPALSAPPAPPGDEGGSEFGPVSQTLALIQPWINYVPRQQRRLGLFVFFAALAQITASFFIWIDTTRTEERHLPRTNITLEDIAPASSPSYSAPDRFWDRLTDPRLFLLPQKETEADAQEPPADFTALNSSIGSQEMPAPVPADDYPLLPETITPLDQRAAAALQPTRKPFVYNETAPPIANVTTWSWGSSLSARQPVGVPQIPAFVSDTDLHPTILRVAIDGGGAVEHALLEQSCGRPELDQQAILAARKVRFLADDSAGLQWGRLTLFWYYAPKPREVVVPTPPSATQE